MKKFLIFAIIVVGGVWFYGRSLPREHEVRSSITLVAQPDTVFQTIRKIGNNPLWWSDLKSVRQVPGRRRETWEQNMGGGMGLITIEIASLVDGQQMVTRVVQSEEESEAEPSWGGTWTYRVSPTASGTQVSITEKGWVDPPFFRIIMMVRGKYRTVDSYLTSLAAHFDEVATPRHRE